MVGMTKIIRTFDNYCLTLNPELESLPIDTKLTFGPSGVPKPAKDGEYIIGIVDDTDVMRW